MVNDFNYIKGKAHEFEEVPVEDVVVGKVLAVEEVPEELPQIRVVRLVLEAETPAERQVRPEFSYTRSDSSI